MVVVEEEEEVLYPQWDFATSKTVSWCQSRGQQVRTCRRSINTKGDSISPSSSSSSSSSWEATPFQRLSSPSLHKSSRTESLHLHHNRKQNKLHGLSISPWSRITKKTNGKNEVVVVTWYAWWTRERSHCCRRRCSLSLSLPSNPPPPTAPAAAAPPESYFLSLSFLRGRSNPSLQKA